MNRMMGFLLVVGMLFGMASALVVSGSVPNALRYHGGTTIAMINGTPTGTLETYANIDHTTSSTATITQNGKDVSELLSGSGETDISIDLETLASVTGSVSMSDESPNTGSVASPKSIVTRFDDAVFSFLDSRYNICKGKYSIDAYEGAHVLNWRIETESGYVYWEPVGYPTGYCAYSFTDPVDIRVNYKPYQNNQNAVFGKGKGYLYCKGDLYVNGKNIGQITSDTQTFDTKVNVTSTMTSLPINAVYKCYFVSELYYADGSKQIIENIVHKMPTGAPIINATVANIPIIVPPPINLIPLITVDTPNGPPTTYTTNTRIPDIGRDTKLNLTFIVRRTDDFDTVPTPPLTWTYVGTPPEITNLITRTTIFDPPLMGGDPPYTLQTPPTEVTVCQGENITDTITFTINPDGNVDETKTNDNTIKLTIECLPPIKLNLIPLITVTLNGTPTTYDPNTPTDMTNIRQNTKVNLTFIVQRTDPLPTPTPDLPWTYVGTPPEITNKITVTTVFDPPLTGGDPYTPYILQTPPTEVTLCEDGKEFDTITFTINPDGDIDEMDSEDNTIVLRIRCQKNEVFYCNFYPRPLLIVPGESESTRLTCRNETNQVDCPYIRASWISTYDNGFGNYFETPVDFDPITVTKNGNDYDVDDFNIVAKETGQSEIAYQGTVSIDIPSDDYTTWNNCHFDVLWQRLDCRYYM